MRPFAPRYIQRSFNLLSRPTTLEFAASAPLQRQFGNMSLGMYLHLKQCKQTAQLADRTRSKVSPKIENTEINTAPGVKLNDHKKLLIGSVLDLFAGRPSKEKLMLWTDDGVFEDPITIAAGREKYEPQWYGLRAAFSEIERLSHEVKSGGNPITMEMKTRYVVKGIGKEQTIASVVNIFFDEGSGKITKVEDKWNGSLPEGSIANVSFSQVVSPVWWVNYWLAWGFWVWSFVWYTRIWRVRDLLSSSLIPSVLVLGRNCLTCRSMLTLYRAGIPPSQRGDGAKVDQGAQERRGGCQEPVKGVCVGSSCQA